MAPPLRHESSAALDQARGPTETAHFSAPIVEAKPAPRVSVVMPVHDGMPYLPLAIDSILGQTFGDFEFIVIDDGSTDATADTLARYAAADARIRVLRHPQNRGIVAALNHGLDAVRGEFIARMDADDIAAPDRLQRQVEFLDRHADHVLVGSSSSFIDASGKMTFRDVYWRQVEHWELEWISHFFTAMLHPTAMFRTAPLRKRALRYDADCRDAEDMELFLRLLQSGKGAILREPLLRYRRIAHGLTARFFAEQKRTARDIAWRGLIARYPDLEAQGDSVRPVIDMLQRQGLPAGQTLSAVFDAMVQLEARFLAGRALDAQQRRRVHCLTAFWLLWGIYQSGRLRLSRETLAMLWRARAYLGLFCVESAAIGLRHAGDVARRMARRVRLGAMPRADAA